MSLAKWPARICSRSGLGHIGNRTAAPDQRLEPLQFLELVDEIEQMAAGRMGSEHDHRNALLDEA